MKMKYQHYEPKTLTDEFTIEHKGIRGFILAVICKYAFLLKMRSKRYKAIYTIGETPVGEQEWKFRPKIKLVRMKGDKNGGKNKT